MICAHQGASVVVWNDLATLPDGTGGGRLTVMWCGNCGAIKRVFPNMTVDWELPKITTEANDIIDWERSG